MFPVHCNKCFKKRDAENALQFELARCHHIVCVNCIPKSPDGRQCPVCKRNFNGVPITRNMPGNIANYFEDPSIYLKMYRSVSKFQSEQRAIYYQHYYQQQAEMANRKRKMHGYIKLETQLRQQNDLEKKRIAELRNYIAYYERRNDVSLSSTDVSSSLRRIRRPRTPSLSATDTTLTDNEADIAEKFNLKEFKQKVSQTISLKSNRKNSNKHKGFQIKD